MPHSCRSVPPDSRSAPGDPSSALALGNYGHRSVHTWDAPACPSPPQTGRPSVLASRHIRQRLGDHRVRRLEAHCRVRARSLPEFCNGDSVEVVKHPVIWRGQAYSPLLPPDRVIDRARWLLHNQPPSYQLGYRNCESVAIWCATGDFESFQVKRFLGWKTVAFLPTVILIRRKPSVGKWVGIASVGVSLLTAIPYIHSRALFDHVGRYPGIGCWSATE